MSMSYDVNTNLLENHGFQLTGFAGKGLRDVYKGICNDRAIRLIKVDPLLADPYDENNLFIGNKAYEAHSIEGKQFAVKIISADNNPDPNVANIAWDVMRGGRAHALQLNPLLIQSVFPQWNADLHLFNPKINFPEEANILLGLNHKNVVTIYDVVIDYGNYTVYIIMEMMEKTLFEFVDDKLTDISVDRLRWKECIDYILQLIDGLVYLHSSGIYHNDIHSGNIMVNHTNGEIVIKYVDLGSATNVRGGGNIAAKFTTTRDLSDLGRVLEWLIESTDFEDYFDYKYSIKHLFNDMINSKISNARQVKVLLQNLMENIESEDLSASMQNFFQ